MKKTSLLCLLMALVIVACSPAKKEEKPADNKPLTKEEKRVLKAHEEHFKKMDADFQAIAVSPEETLRGFNLGDSYDKVKANEKAILKTESDSMLYYHADVSKDEAAEIYYHFTEGKLSRMHVSIKLGTEDEHFTIEADFNSYFTQKFGEAKIVGDNEVWTPHSDKPHEVDLIDKSEGDNYVFVIEVK